MQCYGIEEPLLRLSCPWGKMAYHSSSTLDYLTSVLSQRGPTAVPYDEPIKWNVRDHVSELQKVRLSLYMIPWVAAGRPVS